MYILKIILKRIWLQSGQDYGLVKLCPGRSPSSFLWAKIQMVRIGAILVSDFVLKYSEEALVLK